VSSLDDDDDDDDEDEIDLVALVPFMDNEYNNVPAIAMDEPIMEPVLMGVLKAMTDATIIYHTLDGILHGMGDLD
jgi:hypothetical protein